MVVTRATVLEFPQVEQLRRAYFESIGEPVQRRSDRVVWMIARTGEIVAACASYVDVEDLSEPWRVVHDLYRVPGFRGTRGVALILAWLREQSIIERRTVGASIDARNEQQILALCERGYYPANVILKSRPWEVSSAGSDHSRGARNRGPRRSERGEQERELEQPSAARAAEEQRDQGLESGRGVVGG
jgi:hypothetical protein